MTLLFLEKVMEPIHYKIGKTVAEIIQIEMDRLVKNTTKQENEVLKNAIKKVSADIKQQLDDQIAANRSLLAPQVHKSHRVAHYGTR